MADTDQITPEEYASWIPAPEAIERVGRAMSSRDIGASAMLRRLRAGLLRAHVKAGNVDQSGTTKKLTDFTAVPFAITKAWDDGDYPGTFQFWTSGDAEVHLRVQSDYGHEVIQIWRLFGIRFDAAGIADILPRHQRKGLMASVADGALAALPSALTPAAPAPTSASPAPIPDLAKHAGGAPRK
jgi:hypothetical protein